MPQVRSIFISDVHLGTRGCQAEQLLNFLREYDSEYLFLIGDIVDFWAMQRGVHWSAAQNTVLQKILRRARHGQKVYFIPGNHDETLRDYVDSEFGNIYVVNDFHHTTAEGKNLLLLHGDEFDQITRYHKWLAIVGDAAYNFLVRINTGLSWARRKLGLAGYWSLATYAKQRIKAAVDYIDDFEDAALHAARQRGYDGIVCGHIHSAAMREAHGLIYANCGDWVDSCTAVVETPTGALRLIHWRGQEEQQPTRTPAQAETERIAA
ncbi:MAG: UDP-2,3-diacylglucosamine diphosphatase [Rhodocyclaceae bacterium]